MSDPVHPEIANENLPPLPLTVEGASMLHQMLRIDWSSWRNVAANEQAEIVAEASRTLAAMETNSSAQSALFSIIGHKGDLMLVHFRDSFDALKQAELDISRLAISEFLEPTTSYLSVVELGLYESTVKVYRSLTEQGIAQHSAEWDAALLEVMDRQREAMRSRLFPQIPPNRYLCFYPMDRLRGERNNWYQLPMVERQRQMHEHGLIGRRYAGEVKQIISGSIGFDDWEWGVDLFADDPLVFKRLIYEMRFDQVSAVYAQFGSFYIGLRCPAAGLGSILAGRLPAYPEVKPA